MKPIISESVYKKLYSLITKFKSPQVNLLGKELANAEIVKDDALEKDVVSLNSTVEFFNDSFNKPITLQIVLPEHADMSKRKISIFAPISIALIGFKESARFRWKMPSGFKNLTILKVLNH
mgnify:CR=1 FL=1